MFQNLLGLLKRGKDLAQVGMSLIPGYLANLLWIIETTFLGLARKGYGQNAAVYACLRILSESVPEPPMLVHFEGEDGSLERAPVSHDAQLLIRKPNELQTEYAFWELVTLYVGIVGRCIAWKERDNLGRVIGLWPLRPDRVGPIYSTLDDVGAKVVKGWSYQVPGTLQYIPIPRSETVLFLVPDPAGESGGLVEGLGPMQVLAREISADNEATSLVGSLLANYAQPSLLIKTTVPIMSAEEAAILKQSFKMQMGGAHRGEPAILDGGASIEKLSFDLKELEFPNLRDVSESRISAAFGVPAILVGLKVGIQAAIKATIAEQRELFTEGTLASYWRRFQDAIDSDLLPEFGPNLKSQFDTTKVKALQHQAKEEQDKITDGYQVAAVTLDEYREKVLGLPPIGGTAGNLRFVASTGNFVDDEGLPIMPALPAGGAGGDDQDQDNKHLDVEDERRTAKAIANALVLATRSAGGKRPPKAWGRQLSRLAASSEQAERIVSAQAQPRVQGALDAARDAAVAAFAGAAKANLDPDDILSSSGFKQALAEIDATLRETHLIAVQLGYEDLTHELGTIEASFSLENAYVKRALEELGDQLGRIDAVTLERIRQIISRGIDAGSTYDEIAQAIHNSTAFSFGRARTIAQTEAGLAYGRGAAAAFRDLDATHVYIADGDDWDEPCREVNGTIQTIDWYEANVKQHPNCTRAAAPVPESDV